MPLKTSRNTFLQRFFPYRNLNQKRMTKITQNVTVETVELSTVHMNMKLTLVKIII